MQQRELIAGREVVFEPEDEGGYHASCPELRGCHSYGETLAEARANIAEAIALWVESAEELRFDIVRQR
jgi:predicted RNase H-like HicB family nuclease